MMATLNVLKEVQRLCANCQRPVSPGDTCSCKLVAYCNQDCQNAHLDRHGSMCRHAPLNQPSWRPTPGIDTHGDPSLSENAEQSTSALHRYLWGNMPAIDILKLNENEDEGYENDINILFAASGDLRNVIKTVADLPETFTGKLNIVINDRDANVVSRNALMLLILLYSSENAAIDAMLHLWYSALLTEDQMDLISTVVFPMVEIAYGKTNNAAKIASFPAGKLRLEIAFKDSIWKSLLSCCKRLSDLDGDEAQRLRQTKILTSQTAVDAIYEQDLRLQWHWPFHRSCLKQYNEDGILLPLGHTRDGFTVPNPTLFFDKTWQMAGQENPFDGWKFDEICNVDIGSTTNDISGKLYYYVKAVLRSFRRRLLSLDCCIRLTSVDAKLLKPLLSSNMHFDRIECSNISDSPYLGTRLTVSSLVPLLKSKAENRSATLLTLSMLGLNSMVNFIRQHDPRSRKLMLTESVAAVKEDYRAFGPEVPAQDFEERYFTFLSDMEPFFEWYRSLCSFDEVAEENGLEIRNVHRLVGKYPTKMKKKLPEEGAREEFWHLVCSSRRGDERYVEWKRK